ncbi:MAG: serine/threonine-protein kinase [Planctomycetota bacterium]
MPDNAIDEAFARHLLQIGMARAEQVAEARDLQIQSAQQGRPMPLAEALTRSGAITLVQREEIEKRLRASPDGPQQLGQFKLLRKLGGGAMGTVFLAEDTMAQRQVALKVLLEKYASDPEFLARFHREAKAAGKLSHPNIVTAYTIGEEAGKQYYTMEYCQGETLGKLLDREKVLPWELALDIVIQVARGLQHAHRHGILHRDIKPDNIFIVDDPTGSLVRPGGSRGVAKIVDLGLSKNISDAKQSFYTQTGVAMGTPHYISPEQARGEKDIDGRTDIYSLGATFYHLVTGHTPFSGTSANVIIVEHLTKPLPDPRNLAPGLPDGIVRIIYKMMAKEPADRYPSCAELLADLELVRAGKKPSAQAPFTARETIALPGAGASAHGPPSRHLPSRDHKGAPTRSGPPHTHGPPGHAHATRPHDSALDETVIGPHGRTIPSAARRGWKRLCLGAGVAALCVLVLALALALHGKRDNSKPETGAPLTQLGEYKLVQQVGEGALGTVYMAEDVNLPRKAALTVVPAKYANDAAFVARFRNGAKAQSKLNHPNIALLYAATEQQGTLYLAVEWVAGEDLRRALERDKKLELPKALDIVIQAATGLKYAHDCRVVHRDIKPANLMLALDGKVKIVDFSLALDLAGEQPVAGTVIGTPQYMSPEQWRGDKNLDGRADIYSLGVVFYQVLAGQVPFPPGPQMDSRVLNDPVPSLKALKPDLPDAAVQVIEKMLAKKPEDRYRDCTELLAALEALKDCAPQK